MNPESAMKADKPLLEPEPPFVWPEPRALQRVCRYAHWPPLERLVRASRAVFGTVTALDVKGIDLLQSWLEGTPRLKMRLIVAVYPTCITRQEDLWQLLQLAERNAERAEVRIKPHPSATDRPTNALCFRLESGDLHLVTGPSENLGFEPISVSTLNLAFGAEPGLVKAFEQYFIYLWAKSSPLSQGVTQIPALVLPKGTTEGQRLWEEYLARCEAAREGGAQAEETVRVDPETGEVSILARGGEEIVPPTEAIGIPSLDPLAEGIARLYKRGSLVSVDKRSRIGPLDAPLNPRLFGDLPEIQRGNVSRKVSMRISIIGRDTLKGIEKCRRGLRDLLNSITFGLADNMRWMPDAARVLFESEAARIDGEGQQLLSGLLKGDADAFIGSNMTALANDINDMYQELGGQGRAPAGVLEEAVSELRQRLTKAMTSSFMPAVTYSGLTFDATTNAWASPWAQAYTLLYNIAVFPRKALTDAYFLRGLRVDRDALLDAMNVADDALVRDGAEYGIWDRSEAELKVLNQVEESQVDARDKCELVWRLLKGEGAETVTRLLREKETT